METVFVSGQYTRTPLDSSEIPIHFPSFTWPPNLSPFSTRTHNFHTILEHQKGQASSQKQLHKEFYH